MRLQVDVPDNRVLPSGLVTGIGVVLGLSALVYVDSRPGQPWWWTVEFALAGIFPAILMYSGYWLATSDFDSADLWRILSWTVAGLVVLTTLTALLVLHQWLEGSSLVEPMFTVLLLAMGGALFGLTAAVTHLWRVPVPASAWDGHSLRDAAETDLAASEGGAALGWDLDDEIRRQVEIVEYAAAIGELSVSELAADLSAERVGAFADDFDRVQVHLYQFDLPRLAKTGRIAFDPVTEMIRYTGRPTLGKGQTEPPR